MNTVIYERLFFAIACGMGGLAVTLSAFGSHDLRRRASAELVRTFETGTRFQMFHALALLAVALAIGRWQASPLLLTAGWLLVVGTFIFSGSLYMLVLTARRLYGAITPIGGIVLIAGWILLAAAALV